MTGESHNPSDPHVGDFPTAGSHSSWGHHFHFLGSAGVHFPLVRVLLSCCRCFEITLLMGITRNPWGVQLDICMFIREFISTFRTTAREVTEL